MQEKKENNTKTIHRLTEYITKTGDSFNKLAIKLGLSNSYFSKMVRNGGSIGSDIIENILRVYPDVNPDWLLTGQGEMLRSDGNSIVLEAQSTQQSEVIALLKEQLKDKEAELKELNQEIGLLKSDNRKLMEQVMGLDMSGYKSSVSPSQSPSKDAPSVIAHL